MRRKRHTPEQIVKHLRGADQLLGTGKTVAQVCKRLGVTEVTYYRWRREYGGMKTDQAKRLKELERENGRQHRPACRRLQVALSHSTQKGGSTDAQDPYPRFIVSTTFDDIGTSNEGRCGFDFQRLDS